MSASFIEPVPDALKLLTRADQTAYSVAAVIDRAAKQYFLENRCEADVALTIDRGGNLLLAALRLNFPKVFIYKLRIENSRVISAIESPKRVLLCDTMADTGETLSRSVEAISSVWPASTISCFALLSTSQARTRISNICSFKCAIELVEAAKTLTIMPSDIPYDFGEIAEELLIE